MKKKLLAVILIACLALTTLAACGSSKNNSETEEGTEQTDTDQAATEQAAAEQEAADQAAAEQEAADQAAAEQEAADQAAAEQAAAEQAAAEQAAAEQAAAGQTVRGEYCGMSFDYPANSQYTADDSSAIIIYNDTSESVYIIPVVMSDSEMNESLIDTYLYMYSTIALRNLGDVQDEQSYDLTVGGEPAKATIGVIVDSETLTIRQYCVTGVYNANAQCFYSIVFSTEIGDDNADSSDATAFLESISFN